jgi:diadenosine tetraphosphate (Ap4A) HIT family hydrolase/catechol 2,3-dioxygenase-like lactoylglutathione lyase family enzyme
MNETAIHRRVEACRAGADPTCICRLPTGWAVMGDPQVLEGYCLLLPDPVVPHLNAMPPEAQADFLADMSRLGQAVQDVTGALRVNYAIFGNVEPALHAHVFPRYTDEPQDRRTVHPWGYDWSQARAFDSQRDGNRLAALRARLAQGSVRSAAVSGAERALHHIDLTVADLERSTRYYAAVLPIIGFERIADAEEGPLWRKAGFELGLQGARGAGRERTHDRYSPGLHHVAFAAPAPDAVDVAYRALVALGVEILDAPAAYDRYVPGYYAVFFTDPDGIKLEYVYTPAAPNRSSQ